MKIYTISVLLLFFTIIPVSAQPVRLSKSKTPATTVSLRKDNALNLTLTALIEAMYVAGGTEMPLTPSVTVELHDATNPYAVVESQTSILSTAGVGTFTFTTAVDGTPYYIVVKSPNTVETWSATSQSFTSGSLSYDFSTGVGQAYTDGSNPPLALHGGKYCIYSGDLDQNGQVTTDDFTGVDNDGSNFDYHLVNDVDGNGQVTTNDFTFIDNNGANFVQRQVPSSNASTLVYEGQTYHIVLIGAQYWLKENLNVGTMIPDDQEQTNNNTLEKYCYDNDTANCTIYGGLYQWNEAMQFSTTERAKGICPPGWHLPTLNEFSTLVATVNGDDKALKEIGQGTGTNTSGFSALITPYFLHFEGGGGMFWQDNSSNFWSSTVNDISNANEMYFYSYNYPITLTLIDKGYGFAVRCIKD